MKFAHGFAVAVLAVATACSAHQSTVFSDHPALLPQTQPVFSGPTPMPLSGDIIGFSIDTPARVALATRQGMTSTILYGGAPTPSSALAKALMAHKMSVIDAGISVELFYYECHRTHTVTPPPDPNYPYCTTDEDPSVSSPAVVLANVSKMLSADAGESYVRGYWVLDDWPSWDGGSARVLLQRIHKEIEAKTPGLPAVCGFGAGLATPGHVAWDPTTAKNYSNGGCDVVGWYVYSPFGVKHASSGARYDWTMKALLPAMAHSLERYGWHIKHTPLLGIGQAWSGRFGTRDYQPGLSVTQMEQQARGFCAFGADSISWYAWDDSGFVAQTQTPNNSAVIASGIAAGINACKSIW